ncbi:hypothetical protein B0H13DRAFT_1931887 [Mycena leptocephala]|nr:hypothetical protein B0H13DRAFT_1931887 [Mycena leptocephala]
MSSPTTPRKVDKPAVADEEKRRKDTEAQRKYRERNLDATREKACERMGRLRESAKPLKRRLERRQRQSRDAEYREVLCKRKFVAEFGETAFHEYYLTHQRLLGVDYLPGISQQYRKDMANAQKEKATEICENLETTNPASVASVPIRPQTKANYTTDSEHDGNPRKWWFLIMSAGLFTKKSDTEFQAKVSKSPVLTFGTRAEAEAHWAADCRESHRHARDNDAHNDEASKEEGNRSRPSSTLPFSTPACSTSHSIPANAVRASVKREAPVKDKVEEAKVPLFREDNEVSPLSRPHKRPTPPRPPSLRKRRTSSASTETSMGSISSVSSLSASVGSSASRAAPPLRSGPQHLLPSGLAATYLHAGGSTGAKSVGSSASRAPQRLPSSGPAAPSLHVGSSASAAMGSSASTATDAPLCRHAEPPVLFNKSTRTLYKDPLKTDLMYLGTCRATAVRKMGKEDSIQVLEVEDLEDFFPRRRVRRLMPQPWRHN